MKAHPSFGAVVLGDGRVRFRLWAPGAQKVEVQLRGRGAAPLHAVEDGFHECTIECPVNTSYHYRIDEGALVPDPASRCQDGDVNDASLVVDPASYLWRPDGWIGRPWTDAVIVEIHCGLAGGFEGVGRRLAALADLGVTEIGRASCRERVLTDV